MTSSPQTPRDRDRLVEDQKRYYDERAAEYDRWFLRQGRYDRGPEFNQSWFDEIARLQRFVDDFGPRGAVLELAAGTGLWTERLLRHVGSRPGESLTVVDASAEMIARNRARLGPSKRVRYLRADLFDWRPAERYDTIFFGFWLSHVPMERFEAFWALLRDALAPGGRVAFVDSAFEPQSTAYDHALGPEELAAQTVERRLEDGRRYRIVKVFHEPEALQARLRTLGWDLSVGATERFFIHGAGVPLRDRGETG